KECRGESYLLRTSTYYLSAIVECPGIAESPADGAEIYDGPRGPQHRVSAPWDRRSPRNLALRVDQDRGDARVRPDVFHGAVGPAERVNLPAGSRASSHHLAARIDSVRHAEIAAERTEIAHHAGV